MVEDQRDGGKREGEWVAKVIKMCCVQVPTPHEKSNHSTNIVLIQINIGKIFLKDPFWRPCICKHENILVNVSNFLWIDFILLEALTEY